MTSLFSIGSALPTSGVSGQTSTLKDRIVSQTVATIDKQAALKTLKTTAARLTVEGEIDLARSYLEDLTRTSFRTVVTDTARMEELQAQMQQLESFSASVGKESREGGVSLSNLQPPAELTERLTALSQPSAPNEITYLAEGGAVVLDAVQFTANEAGTKGLVWQANAANDRMVTEDIEGDIRYERADDVVSQAARLDYKVAFQEAGTYRVLVRGHSTNLGDSKSNSVHVGLNGEVASARGGIELSVTGLSWGTRDTFTNDVVTIEVAEAGTHTFNLWMREDGAAVDSVMLTKDFELELGQLDPEVSEIRPGPETYATDEVLTAIGDARAALEAEMSSLVRTEEVESQVSPYLQKVIEAQQRGLERLNSAEESTKEQLAKSAVAKSAYKPFGGLAALSLLYSYDLTGLFLQQMQSRALDQRA